MHELSIAMSIVELAEEESELRGGLIIKAVRVRVGSLSGVVKAALLSSYEMARENTVLAESALVLEEIPAVIYCSRCQSNRATELPEWFRCPGCGSLSPEIIHGKELEVVSFEVEA